MLGKMFDVTKTLALTFHPTDTLMKKFGIFALSLTLLSTPALAQDISVKMAQIPAGSWLLSKAGKHTTIQVFRGKQGRSYVVDFVQGKDPNAPRSARDLRDEEGNVLKRTNANGEVTTYRPHNCQRTIGRCEFVQKTGNKTAKMVRVNTPKGKGFTFEQTAIWPDGNTFHVQSGTVKSLDKFGVVERASGQQLNERKKFSTRKVKASWD